MSPSDEHTAKADIEQLFELIAWVRDKLDRLGRQVDDEFVKRNVKAIASGLDPRRNPRLGGIVSRHKEREAKERPALRELQARIVAAYRDFARKDRAHADAPGDRGSFLGPIVSSGFARSFCEVFSEKLHR